MICIAVTRPNKNHIAFLVPLKVEAETEASANISIAIERYIAQLRGLPN
jgi:hypothetical protein